MEVDYKEMYLKMVRATEEAMNILIRAQRECEEIYLDEEKTHRAIHSPMGRTGRRARFCRKN